MSRDYLEITGLSKLMGLTNGQSEVIIGLIDGPIDISHPDFSELKLVNNPIKGSTACRIRDSNACAHGTFITGILCSKRMSIAPGICPGCTLFLRPIFPEEIQGNTPRTTPKELSAAIIECVSAGANIINLSVGLTQPNRSEEKLAEALDYAMKRSVIVVVAAGNQGIIGGSSLTNHQWVIPVIACDSNGKPMSNSNFGSSIGINGLSAPGDRITSLAPNGKSLTMSGTSVAAPFVTGTIALLWSLFPETCAAGIKLSLKHGNVRTTIIPPLLDALEAYRFLVKNRKP